MDNSSAAYRRIRLFLDDLNQVFGTLPPSNPGPYAYFNSVDFQQRPGNRPTHRSQIWKQKNGQRSAQDATHPPMRVFLAKQSQHHSHPHICVVGRPPRHWQNHTIHGQHNSLAVDDTHQPTNTFKNHPLLSATSPVKHGCEHLPFDSELVGDEDTQPGFTTTSKWDTRSDLGINEDPGTSEDLKFCQDSASITPPEYELVHSIIDHQEPTGSLIPLPMIADPNVLQEQDEHGPQEHGDDHTGLSDAYSDVHTTECAGELEADYPDEGVHDDPGDNYYDDGGNYVDDSDGGNYDDDYDDGGDYADYDDGGDSDDYGEDY